MKEYGMDMIFIHHLFRTIIYDQGEQKTKFNAKWEVQKAKLKLRFPQLTEGELSFEEGKKAEMMGKLERRLGKTSKEIRAVLETL